MRCEMVMSAQPETVKEVFFNLLGKNRLMPNLAIEKEAGLLLSRVRFALASSVLTEESRDLLINGLNHQGPIECIVPIASFNELSHPDNRNLLLAAIALEVERADGNPDQVNLVRRASSVLSFLSNAFDQAVIRLPSVAVATRLCEPNSEEAKELKQGARGINLSPS